MMLYALLAAVVAVAVVGGALAVWRMAAQRDAARRRLADATERLQAFQTAADAAGQEARAFRARAAAAEQRATTAESRASRAEKRAGESERRVAELLRERGPETLWQLERLRVEREWAEVAGPGSEPPLPWDGSLAPVLATELAILREVAGTPGRLDAAPGTPSAPDPVAARACVELLRALARQGEEISVVLGPQGVEMAAAAGSVPEGVRRVMSAVAAAGIPVDCEAAGGRVRISVPAGPW